MVMGVIDVSASTCPGRPDPDECLERALQLVEEGADYIDITVLPSAPPARRIEVNDERARLVPTLRKVLPRVDIPVAVTTYHSATAERVLGLGVGVICDPTGLAFDPDMANVIKLSDAAVVLGHAPDSPESWSRGRPVVGLPDAVRSDLDSSVARARLGGIDRRRIVLDPGLGFSKKGLQNYEILERWGNFARLGQPTLVCAWRKPFLTESIRAPEEYWRAAEAAAVALAVSGGAHLIRTGDVPTARAAAYAGDRILESTEVPPE